MVSGWVVLTMSVILIILGSIAAALVAFGKKWILHRMFAGLVCIQICPLIYGSVVVLGEKFETLKNYNLNFFMSSGTLGHYFGMKNYQFSLREKTVLYQ